MPILCEYGIHCFTCSIQVTYPPYPLCRECIMYIDANEIAEALLKLSTSNRVNQNLLFQYHSCIVIYWHIAVIVGILQAALIIVTEHINFSSVTTR